MNAIGVPFLKVGSGCEPLGDACRRANEPQEAVGGTREEERWEHEKKNGRKANFAAHGGDGGTRTPDLFDVSEAL